MTLPVPLINRERAETVMNAYGVDALVLSEVINVYHGTGFWPQTLTMGHLGSSFAVVPADKTKPVALITSQFLHYFYNIDEGSPTGPLDIYLYTAPDGTEEGAAPPNFYSRAEDGTPDPFEVATRAATTHQLALRPQYPTAVAAIRAALGDLAAGKSIASDGYIAPALLGDAFTYRPAEPLLRRIRMIKSAPEIALMRHAARNNAEAAHLAITSMRPGNTYDELRRAFFAETGRRGGIPLFISTDSVSSRQRDGVIREGRSFQIDAVSIYAGYHGDYGRTIFVGEPSAPVRRAMDAAITCNETLSKALKPGLHYSDIVRIGRAAVAEAGFDVAIASSPHSVGLFHTDESFKDDTPNYTKDDHLIEKDMTLSMDCPVFQTDKGGHVHLEDLWLVTADGCEALNDRSDPFIQLPLS